MSDTPASSSSPACRINFLDLPLETVRWIVTCLVALHVGALMVLLSRRPAAPGSEEWPVEAALVICTILLVAPLVHKAHMLWVLPGVTAAMAGELAGRGGRFAVLRRILLATSFASLALMTPVLGGRFFPTDSRSLFVFLGVEALWLNLALTRYSVLPRTRTLDGAV